MAFSLSNNIITQTGTDNNLAGLANIAGVTTITEGAGPFQVRVYRVGARRLVINGTLSHNPLLEKIIFSDTAPFDTLTVNGTYNYGKVTTFSGENNYVMDTGLIFTRRHTEHWNQWDLQVNSGGVFNWISGRIQGRNCSINPLAGGSIFVTKGHVYSEQGSTFGGENVFAWVNVNSISDSLTLEGNAAMVGQPTGAGALLLQGDAILQYAAGGSPIYRNLDFFACQKVSTLGYAANPILINPKRGTNTAVSSFFEIVTVNNGGQAEAWSEVELLCRGSSGQALEGEVVYVQDNDNGFRKNATSNYGGGINLLNDTQFIFTSDATGVAAGDVLLGAVVSTGVSAPSNGLDATPAYRWDRRGKTDNAGQLTNLDDRDFFVWGYDTLLSQFSASLNGFVGPARLNTVKLPDINVTLSDAAAGALTTITTADELYDAAKYWKTRPIQTNLEYPTIDTQPIAGAGSLLDLGTQTLVMDGAAPVFNAATGTITVNATTIAAGAKFNTIRATEVVGDLAGVDVEGTWRTQLPVTLTGRKVTKLIVDGGTGDITLTNCEIGEIENQSGTDSSVFLTGTPVPTLTETNGALNVATVIAFNDAAGGDFTLLVINPADNSVVRAYDPTPAGTYIVDAGARSQLRIAAYKRGHYTLVRTFDISGDATFPLVFTAVPFVDMDEDVSAIKNDLTTEVIANPYPGINALVRGTFASPHSELSQNQFKRVFVDFQGRQDVMELLAEFNLGGADVFASTSTGVDILRAVVQFAVAGNFEVNTLAFVDTTSAVALTSAYVWNPENANNRKVIGSPVPILLQSNLGLDGGSGGSGGATAQEIWSFPTRTLTSGGGSSGVTLAEIEASAVLAKEASVLARPTLAEMEASAALTAVADVSGLATQTSVTALGTPLQAGDYTAPDNATITAINTKVQTLENTDLTGIATSAEIQALPAPLTAAETEQAAQDALTAYGAATAADVAGAAGPSLAEIEGSAVLAKEATVVALGTPLQAGDYTAPPTSADNATAVWGATIRSLTDKSGFELTASERSNIAIAVEAALLDDGDGQALLEAIALAIGNQNVDEIALVAAIRADLERNGGQSDQTLRAAKLAAALSA